MKNIVEIKNNNSNNKHGILFSVLLLILFAIFPGCKKLLDVGPNGQLNSDQIFNNEGSANSAIAGIYKQSRDNLIYSLSVFNSLASDDINKYNSQLPYIAYYNNKILSTEGTLPWNNFYAIVYSCNAAIEGLQKSTALSQKAKDYYIGEAKFNRAFCYFHLVNLFGAVPLITVTDVNISSTASRTGINTIYGQIVADLTDAQTKMDPDYNYTGGERIRANKWVATALLARVYLFQKEYGKAEQQANAVISSGKYDLLSSPTGIFNKNNSEAILQWANNPSESNLIASEFIFTNSPGLRCTPFLMNAFESNDLRKTTWIQSKVYPATGELIAYPFKFTSTAVGTNEYYTVLRLAEQYLIRAEARAMRNDFAGAISDVNLIRSNHGGLNIPLPAPISQSDAVNIILHERQVDLFIEGMHRWFDLKRTGKVNETLLTEKPSTWNSTAQLYPIPSMELQKNLALTQNPGYN